MWYSKQVLLQEPVRSMGQPSVQDLEKEKEKKKKETVCYQIAQIKSVEMAKLSTPQSA